MCAVASRTGHESFHFVRHRSESFLGSAGTKGMHPRLGERTMCLNLDANVAQMICKMYVAQCDVEMLDL